MLIGDVVARAGHGRAMLVVDVAGDRVVAAWRRFTGDVLERDFHRSALVRIKKAPTIIGRG